MTTINENIAHILNAIERCCETTGRPRTEVKLLAVSKTRTAEALTQALKAGQTHFGENYLQEALDKIRSFTSANPERASWHFIGAIQSNKTRDIAAHFDWVHSISSTKVARRLSEQRLDHPEFNQRGPIQALLQVNLSGESSKSGMTPEEAQHTIDLARGFTGVELRGLMTIPEANGDETILRQRFSDLRSLKDSFSDAFDLPAFNELSMGMTQDFPIAIEEGATWIRIGTAIFGPRV